MLGSLTAPPRTRASARPGIGRASAAVAAEAVERVPAEKRRDNRVHGQLPPLERPVAAARLVGDGLVVGRADPGDAVVHTLHDGRRSRAGRPAGPLPDRRAGRVQHLVGERMSGGAGCSVAGGMPRRMFPPAPYPVVSGSSAMVAIRGATASGRIHWVTMIRAASRPASVRAMAGSVRRVTRPAVTPSAKANSAYPTGTMSRWSNGPYTAAAARSSGAAHHVTSALSSPVTATVAVPATASLTASQRVRLMLWVQTSRWVPASYSRATSGAPQNAPISAGATITTRPSAVRRAASLCANAARAGQPGSDPQARRAAVAAAATCGRVARTTAALATRPIAAVQAEARNWRTASRSMRRPALRRMPGRARRGPRAPVRPGSCTGPRSPRRGVSGRGRAPPRGYTRGRDRRPGAWRAPLRYRWP